MKLFVFLLVTVNVFISQAQQDLIFDNTFNGDIAHKESNINDPSNEFLYTYGEMKEIAPNTFMYFVNYYNSSWEVTSKVIVKKIDQNGTINELTVMNQTEPCGGLLEYVTISDLLISDNNEIFVIRNRFNGAERYIQVLSFDYNPSSHTSSINSDWGSLGVYDIPVAGMTNVSEAKGSMNGAGIVLAYTISNGSFPFNIGVLEITAGGTGHLDYNVTNNPTNMCSKVVDIIVSDNDELFIADNAYTYNGGNGTYNDAARVLKLNNFALDMSYGVNGIADISWNSQLNAGLQQDIINKMYYDGSNILVAGYTTEDNGNSFPQRGRVTRLTANGTLDNTFANNGIFDDHFGVDFFNWRFNDIDFDGTNKFYLSTTGSEMVSGSPGNENSFIVEISDAGVMNTNVGTNGYLFKTTDPTQIKELIIVEGSSPLSNQFVYIGLTTLFDNSGSQIVAYSESSLGRLVWENGNVNTNELAAQEIIRVYPNPAQTMLNIQTQNKMTIEILDVAGTIVAKQILIEGNNIVEVGNLKSGVYYLKADTGSTVKFIKQ